MAISTSNARQIRAGVIRAQKNWDCQVVVGRIQTPLERRAFLEAFERGRRRHEWWRDIEDRARQAG